MTSVAEQPSITPSQPQAQQQREDGLTAEEMQEKAEVETSLGKHILDLQNALNINDEIVKENNEIDQNIFMKEKVFERLLQQNDEDMIQLELEKPSQLEAFAYEVSITEAKVGELRRFKLRYDEIEAENESLRRDFSSLSEKFSDDAKKHADEMHNLNKGMQSMRQELENIFHKKLIDMDVKFQEQAFGNLNDRKKKELLDHSKLQDEIAMQENGLTNLMIRISRGKNKFASTKKTINRLHKKASVIRSKLKEYRHVKSVTAEKLQACNAEISELRNDSADLLKLLNSWPYIDDIENALIKCENDSEDIKKEYSQWERRLHALHEVESDFRSLRIRRKKATKTNNEKKVSNSASGSIENIKHVPSIVSTDCVDSVSLADVRKAINLNPFIREIFEPMMGKENLLAMHRGSPNIDKNPLAWLTKSIITLWSIEGDTESQLMSTSVGLRLEEDGDDKNDGKDNDRDTSDELEDLWETAFEDEDINSKIKSSGWMRTVSSPKIFPNDFTPLEVKDVVSSVDRAFKAILKDVEAVRIPSPKKVNNISIPPIRSTSEDAIDVHRGKRKKSSSMKRSSHKDMISVKGVINKSLSANAMLMKAAKDAVDVSTTMN